METLQNTAFVSHEKLQFLPSATATVATFATVEPSKHSHTKIGTTVLLVALLASCQPSYAEVGKSLLNGNSDFVQELNKINQLSFFDSFNCIDKVAVTGNNEVLSQNVSVSPLRHSGIFLPIVQQDGSAMPLCRVDIPKYKTLLGEHGWRFLHTESETRHPNASQALAVFLNQM